MLTASELRSEEVSFVRRLITVLVPLRLDCPTTLAVAETSDVGWAYRESRTGPQTYAQPYHAG